MNKKPYIRKEINLKVNQHFSNNKESVNKKHKNFVNYNKANTKKQSHQNTLIEEQIFRTINMNDQLSIQQIEKHKQTIQTYIWFNERYKLEMNLPTDMRINQLKQLVACYVKLHLKYRTSEHHSYTGLVVKNPFKLWHSNRLKCTQNNINLANIEFQRSMKNKISQNVNKYGEKTKQQEENVIQWKERIKRNSKICNQAQLRDQIVRYIMESMKLSLKWDKLGHGKSIYEDKLKDLLETIRKDDKVEQINLVVRYESLIQENQRRQVNQIDEQKARGNFINQRDKYVVHNPVKCRVNQSILQLRQLTGTSKDNGIFRQLIKWFAHSQLVDWLLMHYHIMDTRTSTLKPTDMIDSKGRKQSFSDQRVQQQLQISKQKVQTFPLRLKGQQENYHLLICNFREKSIDELNKELKCIYSGLILQDVPLTHSLKQLYLINIKQQKNNITQSYDLNYHSNFNCSSCEKVKEIKQLNGNHKQSQIGYYLMPLQITHYQTVPLQTYLKSIISNLSHILQLEHQVNILRQKEQQQRHRERQRRQQYCQKRSKKEVMNEINAISQDVVKICFQLSMLLGYDNMCSSSLISLISIQKCSYRQYPLEIQPWQWKVMVDSVELVKTIMKNGLSIAKFQDSSSQGHNIPFTKMRQLLQQKFYQQLFSLVDSSQANANIKHQIYALLNLQRSSTSTHNNIQSQSSIRKNTSSVYRNDYHHLIDQQTQLFLSKICPKQQNNSANQLFSLNSYLQTQIANLQQRLASFESLLIFNITNIAFVHTYHRPKMIKFLQGDQLNIYQKQTTLKKNKLSHPQTSHNSPSHTKPIKSHVYRSQLPTSINKINSKMQYNKNKTKKQDKISKNTLKLNSLPKSKSKHKKIPHKIQKTLKK